MRQEIVTDEEAQEYKVIDQSFCVILEWKLQILKLKVQIFTDDRNFNELKVSYSSHTRFVLSIACTTLG